MADVKARIEGLLEAAGIEAGLAAIGVESGAVLEINAEAPFPTASVFKVPVMVEVYAQADAGRFGMSDRIVMTEPHKTVGSGVLQSLGGGLAPTVRDLVTLMMIVSDNTATDMLMERIGPGTATARMLALGLEEIHVPLAVHQIFLRGWHLPVDGAVDYAGQKAAMRERGFDYESGAFARDGTNNVSTARDMARLLAMIGRREVVSAAACEDMIAVLEQQHYIDRVPRFLPTGASANKTGTLRGLRNDAGLLRRGAGDTIAYTLFTMDATPMPNGNSRAFAEANARVAAVMGEVGAALWEDFGLG